VRVGGNACRRCERGLYTRCSRVQCRCHLQYTAAYGAEEKRHPFNGCWCCQIERTHTLATWAGNSAVRQAWEQMLCPIREQSSCFWVKQSSWAECVWSLNRLPLCTCACPACVRACACACVCVRVCACDTVLCVFGCVCASRWERGDHTGLSNQCSLSVLAHRSSLCDSRTRTNPRLDHSRRVVVG
jgi:hypothetical protein